MKQTVRYNAFETNSSSSHTLTYCTKEDYEKYTAMKYFYNQGDDEFTKKPIIADLDEFFSQWADCADEPTTLEERKMTAKDAMNALFDYLAMNSIYCMHNDQDTLEAEVYDRCGDICVTRTPDDKWVGIAIYIPN